MRRKLQAAVLAMAFMLLAGCPGKADTGPDVYVTDMLEPEKNMEDCLENDRYMLRVGREGELYLILRNGVDGQPYRARLSGVAADGQEFEYDEPFSDQHFSEEVATFRNLAAKPGIYGPYSLEITGAGEVRTYEVGLVMEYDLSAEGWTAVIDEGRIRPRSFAQEPSSGSFSIREPWDGEILMGEQGYELPILRKYSGFSGKTTFQLTDPETGRVLGSMDEDLSYYGEEPFTGYRDMPMILSEAFEPGREYELSMTDGETEDTVRIVLEDTSLLDEPLEDGNHFSVCMIYNDVDEHDIETFKQDGRYVIPTNEEGDLWIGVKVGGLVPYRLRLSGTAQDGEYFERNRLFTGDGQFEDIIAETPGTYGPYLLEIIGGGQTLQYDIDVVVPESVLADGEYGIAVEGYTDTPQFVEVSPEGGNVKLESPKNGTVFYGQDGDVLNYSFYVSAHSGKTTVSLSDPETGEEAALDEISWDEDYGTIYDDTLAVDAFESGKTYELAVANGGKKSAVDLVLIKEPEAGTLADIPQGNELAQMQAPGGATTYSAEVAGCIQAFLDGMKAVDTDDYHDFLRYRFTDTDLEGAILKDFSIHNPNVSREEADYNIMDMTSAANWLIYEEYQFQVGDMDDFAADARPIDTEALDERFGDEWVDVDGFDFAQGFCRTDDGTVYNWIPVYYHDADDGIYGGRVYLFAYIVWPGADEEYLSERAYYPFFEDCQTEKLLISDPETVAKILDMMRQESGAFEFVEDTNEYGTLVQDSTGDAVRAVQAALVEKGFMTSSVDGYYGPMTVEAVSAYQEAMGLEPTGEADASLQRMLLSDKEDKNLLAVWLDAQNPEE